MTTYQEFLEEAMRRRTRDHPVWRYNTKMRGRKLAESLGVPTPELLSGPSGLEKLTPPTTPAVLKPNEGCSALGVFALVPQEDKYHELLRNRIMSWRQVKAAGYFEKKPLPSTENHLDRVKPPWLIEELLPGPLGFADDWKCYVFGGRVEVIRQIRRAPKGLITKGWSRDMEHLGNIWTRSNYSDKLDPPYNPDEIVRVAELIASKIESPFIRVDLYDTTDKVYFGEVTPHPAGGRLRFTPEWDERLGKAWQTALSSQE